MFITVVVGSSVTVVLVIVGHVPHMMGPFFWALSIKAKKLAVYQESKTKQNRF
jgi:hypothetical protein